MIKPQYVPIIRKEAEKIREKYAIEKNAVIGDYIFTILKDECVLLQWPNEEQLDLDGFSTSRVIGNAMKTVVYRWMRRKSYRNFRPWKKKISIFRKNRNQKDLWFLFIFLHKIRKFLNQPVNIQHPKSILG